MALDSATHCVNDLLYYVNFRRKIAPVNDVVATCETFYTADVILDAKKSFFNIVGEHEGIRFVDRRGKSGKNPSIMNLEDLVNAMTKCDNDGIAMPVFLSADYSKIPHGNDGNVTMSQLLSIIVGMKAQLSNLERKSHSCAVSEDAVAQSVAPPASFASVTSTAPPAVSFLAPSAGIAAASAATSASSAFTASTASTASLNASAHVFTPDAVSEALATALPHSNSAAPVLTRQAGKFAKQTGKTVENRIKSNFERKKGIVIGKMPSSGLVSWRGAPLTVDCYIGRVDLNATADEIKAFVISKGIDVSAIEENVTMNQRFKSFKLVIKKTDYEKLDDRDLWPEGVVFQRFWRPRNAGAGGVIANPIT